MFGYLFRYLGRRILGQEDQDEEESDNEQPSPEFEQPQSKIKSYKEAILSLEDIQLFLESRGCLQDAMQVGNFMDNLSAVQTATAKQTTLHDFI